MAKELDLIYCVDPVKKRPLYGRLRYFRLHGKAGYQSRYGPEDLRKVLEIWQDRVYCLFNNSTMFEDALKFLRLVEEGSGSA